jgi:glutathione S-transferase
LRELGVDFEFINVNLMKGEHRQPEFLSVNPAGKLPVLVDGDFVLTESVAIVLYLADKFPEKGFLPAGVRSRAEVNRWLLFTATELEQPLWRISGHTAIYPKEEAPGGGDTDRPSGFPRHGGGHGEAPGESALSRRRHRDSGGFRSGIHARLGQRSAATRYPAAPAGLHGADVRSPESPAADCGGIR